MRILTMVTKYLVVDIEANGLLDKVSAIHCICIKNLETGKEGSFFGDNLHKAIDGLNAPDTVVIGHNFIGYDLPVLKKFFPMTLTYKNIIDTCLLSRMMYPDLSRHRDCPPSKQTIDGRKTIGPHSLENWSYIVGGAEKIGVEDWLNFTPEMLQRCKNDVLITERVYKHLIG